MAVELTCGTTNQSTTAHSASYWYLDSFQAIKTSTSVTEFRVWSPTTGYIKVAVYANSTSNEPTTLLSHDDSTTLTCISTGWNTLTIPTVSISSGLYYWLSFNANSSNMVGRTNAGGNSLYHSETWSTFVFPNPCSTISFFTSGTLLYSFALWGETGAVSGTPIPVYLNNMRQQGII